MKQFLLVLGILVTAFRTEAQDSSCPNSDLESGNFNYWQGTTGWCCPINSNTPGIVNNRHTIMTGAGTDPNTNGAVSVVAPGGSYSARLGNQGTGAQAEQLIYSLLVDETNSLFVYRYAVILEDPSHSPAEQPRFEIRVFDENGDSDPCGLYNVYAQENNDGFVSITNQYGAYVHYRDWTTVGMDLSDLIGQTVTIEFSTGDCSQGGHYGYAYIDAYCSPLQLTSDFCPGLATTTLSAPVGFESYLWSTGETTETIVVNNPETGQEFSCVLTSVTGCTVTLTSVLTPSIVFAGFDYEGHCMNSIDLIDESFVQSGPPIDSIVWDFGDGTLAYGDTTFHQFDGPGPHDITQVVFSETGCTDTLVQTISFDPSPVVDFEVSPACVDQPTQFEDVTFLADGVAQRIWDFGNGSTTIGDPSPSQIYDATGTFDVSLYIQYNNGCHDSLIVPVTVYETPVVDIGPDSMFCGGTEWLLDAGNPAFAHEWNTGDQQQTLLVTETGDYSVIVTTNEGCTETDTASIYFHPLPVLQLNDTSACVEEPVILDAGNPGHFFQWSNGQTTQQIEVAGNSGTFSVVIITPEGCVDSTQATVTFYPSIFLELGPDQDLCEGDTLRLNAINTDVFYFWNDGSTDSTLHVWESGTYAVEVTNGYCFAQDSITVKFEPYPDPVPETLYSACFDIPGTVVTLDAGSPGDQHSWITGSNERTIDVYDYGWYTVEITGYPDCTTLDSILVEEYCGPHIYLPNSFTPDGDGKNDKFGPVANEIHSVEFMVFDRWGKVIFRSEDPQPIWDGSANGKRVPIGVYVWQCSYRPYLDVHGNMGEVESMIGHVTVVH